MNLEPVIQNEVSQKEKNKYCILTHIYGIYKYIYLQSRYRDALVEDGLFLWTQWGVGEREGGLNPESCAGIYTPTCIN